MMFLRSSQSETALRSRPTFSGAPQLVRVACGLVADEDEDEDEDEAAAVEEEEDDEDEDDELAAAVSVVCRFFLQPGPRGRPRPWPFLSFGLKKANNRCCPSGSVSAVKGRFCVGLVVPFFSGMMAREISSDDALSRVKPPFINWNVKKSTFSNCGARGFRAQSSHLVSSPEWSK